MADLIDALRLLLLEDDAVAGLAGARVFGGELPATETEHMPRHALVIAPSGGPSLTFGSKVQHDAQRFDLFAYGATVPAADQLRRAADRALRGIERVVSAGVLIHWVRRAGGFSTGRDPALAWPRSFQSFQAFHALEEI